MNKVLIVDYGMCNLDSIARAIEECGGKPLVSDNAHDVESGSRIVLPGVGAFPDAMRNLRKRALDEAIVEQASCKEIPLLGICLGMQLLAGKGWEVEETEGLGLVPGEVLRLAPLEKGERVPHIGWNEVVPLRDSVLFDDVPTGKDFYFVHSYHLVCSDERDPLAQTPYCGGFVSAVQRGPVFGVQFHPEKSQRLGFQVLRNFLRV